jgi:hypothetical protein
MSQGGERKHGGLLAKVEITGKRLEIPEYLKAFNIY